MKYFVAILSCFLLPAQSGVPPSAAEKVSIDGTVVNAITGEVLKKVHLTLRPLDQQKALPYGGSTDANGHFVMDDIDPGRYTLTASRNGFIAQSYSPDGNARRVATLTLATGQKIKDLIFKLTPQGVIIGRVIDEDGEPLADVSVQAMVFQYQRGIRQLLPAGGTSTNDLGEFRLHNLRPGKYIISASRNQRMIMARNERVVGSAQAAQLSDEGYITTYYPSAASAGGATQVEIAPGGQVSGINIALVRAHTVSIKGHVSLPTGIPEPSANVSLLPRDNVVILYQQYPPQAIDARGNFEIRGVASGSYWLRSNCALDGKPFVARLPVDVGTSDVEGIELTLQPPLELAGHVVMEGDAELKNPAIFISFRQKNSFSSPGTQVKNDLTFKLGNLERTAYDISVTGLPQDFYLKSVRTGPEDVTETGIDLSTGSPEDLTITINPNGGTIEGSAQSAKDEPAAGALVTLIPDASHRSLLWLFKTANTDQNGHFTIRGVRPGEYQIYAWESVEPVAYQDPEFLKTYEGQAVSMKEGSQESVQLKLIPAE